MAENTEHTDAEGRRVIQRSSGPSSVFFARIGFLAVAVGGIGLGWFLRGPAPTPKAYDAAVAMDAMRWTASLMQAPRVESDPSCDYTIDGTEMTVTGGFRQPDGKCVKGTKPSTWNAEVCRIGDKNEPGLQFWFRNMEGSQVYVTPCTPPRHLAVGHS